MVYAPRGLFPRPLATGKDLEAKKKVLTYFKLIGRTAAKALADQRLLDLPLMKQFWR